MIVEDETYISLINDIYDAALDHKCWLGAMEKIADFVGGSATNIFLHDKADGQSVYFQWGNDPYYDRLYFEKYAPLNPMFPGAMLFDVGQVQAQNDVVPYHEFYETRFFKEWMEPQGIVDSIGGIVEKSAGSVAMLVVRMHQRDGLVNDDMRRRFSLVLPHVRRSLLIGQVISFKEAKAAVMAETLSRLTTAMFLVDGRGGIVLANDAGSELLAEGVVAHGAAGQLNIVSREVNRILIAACAASAEQDSSGLPGRRSVIFRGRGALADACTSFDVRCTSRGWNCLFGSSGDLRPSCCHRYALCPGTCQPDVRFDPKRSACRSSGDRCRRCGKDRRCAGYTAEYRQDPSPPCLHENRNDAPVRIGSPRSCSRQSVCMIVYARK
jgi:hypothetical protein